ncbi:MAG TPA: hypothetical protein VHX88_21525 [Solirubrobacteraceae bacterium]|jgi:hypothetical protein|nr:hypothetical protein [Solirubrobacteraceae bacterium]
MLGRRRTVAPALVVALLLSGAVTAQTSWAHGSRAQADSAAHHKHKARKKKHKAKKRKKKKKPVAKTPSTGYTLKGLGLTVTPQSGVGSITLPSTLTPTQILADFGQPPKTVAEPDPVTLVGGKTASLSYTAPTVAQGVFFTFDTVNGDILNQVSVTSPAYRTSSGIGVGSTPAQVRAAYPSAQCPPAETDQCLISGNDANGNVIQTSFDLFGGKVDQIDITDSD